MAGGDDRLQQYFDGELTGEAADAVRLELEESSEVRAKLEGLAQLRTLLARAADDRGDEIDSDALFAGITAKLATASDDDDPMLPVGDEADDEASAEPPRSARPQLGVIPGGKKADTTAAPAAKKRSNAVWLGTAAVLAVAAAVLLIVLPRVGGGGQTGPDAPLAAAPPPGSEVVDVDFGYSTGAIFSVEGQEGERLAVVWISDDKPIVGESEERMQ